jgi:hypothetical protein
MSLSAKIAALPTTPSPAEPGQEHLQLARMEVAADALAQAAIDCASASSCPAGPLLDLIKALSDYAHIRTNGGAAPGVKS